MAAKPRPGVDVRTAADGTKTYRVRWRPGGGRGGAQQSHTFHRLNHANALHDELVVGGWICYCRKHAPEGEPVAAVPTGIRPGAGDRVGTQVPAGPLFGTFARRHANAMTGIGEGYRRDVLRDIDRHLQLFNGRPLEAITTTDVREWIRGMEIGSLPWLHRADCRWAKSWDVVKAKAATEGQPLGEVLARMLEAHGGVIPCDRGVDGAGKRRPPCDAIRSPATVRRNLAQAGGIVRAAYDEGLVSRNVFRGHRLQRPDTGQDHDRNQVFLTHAEWQLLRSCLPEGVYRDLCTCLVGTGLRWGEVAALAVGAVDVLATPPRLHVARAWKKDGKGGVILGVPKSSRSRRTVTFTAAVRDALIPHVVGKADDELVFTTPRGRPLLHSNFYGKIWLPSVEKARSAGLEKRPRLHDLRHTYVSWLIAEGRPIAEISRRIGHQSYNLTADRYGHIMEQSDVATLAALERAMPVSEAAPDGNRPGSPESGSSASP